MSVRGRVEALIAGSETRRPPLTSARVSEPAFWGSYRSDDLCATAACEQRRYRILLVSRGLCWGATEEPACVGGVAWWRVREWLDRRAGRQGVEPVTLAIGDVPVCPPGPTGQRRLSMTSWR